ncbi:Serine aminopeptidase, S33 [Nonomuraea solani]|uniref:Serine aminopeptidase, S33 n=1 Tax=Nonomuraea solani TaxID=1144553 RepID=A0A1H6EVQ1_9ACTN|nr:alpha/beta fold hydrolase [Nonomuraea solani]SEH01842.1 Serine aminopeptidase, S33 [Nonomuraea solani]
MRRTGGILLVVTLLAATFLLLRLGSENWSGPPRRDVEIAGRIPATVFVPGRPPAGHPAIGFTLPRPAGQRPPVVVIAHGHSADREMMSPIARSLARAGYAVVAFDLAGHGASRTPFSVTPFASEPDRLRADLKAVVDWLGTYPYVDGRRVLLMGHSLGAALVLDFASRDPRPVGTVALSGSVNPALAGPLRPRNALFLVAAGDARPIHEETLGTARQLADVTPEEGRTYGDPLTGQAVRRSLVPGTDHMTVLWSDTAFREAVAWMDTSAGNPARRPPGLDDPRLGLSAWYLPCALVLLAGLGVAVGRAARRTAPRPPDVRATYGMVMTEPRVHAVVPEGNGPAGTIPPQRRAHPAEGTGGGGGSAGGGMTASRAGSGAGSGAEGRAGSGAGVGSGAGMHWRLGLFLGAMLVSLPFQYVGGVDGRTLAGFLGLEGGDAMLAFLAISGGILLAIPALAPASRLGRVLAPPHPLTSGAARLVPPVLVGLAGTYVLLAPLGPVFHRLVPTSERAIAGIVSAALALPFFLALEGLLRRGNLLVAVASSLAGRLLAVIVVYAGLALGVFQDIVGLYALFLGVLLLLFEPLAAAAYATGRDPRVAALIQAGLLGWIVAVTVPWSG